MLVWASVSDPAAWIVAEVIERRDADVVLLRKWPVAAEGADEQFTISKAEFERLVPAPAGPPDSHVPDLCQLAEVSSGAVLHNLRLRFADGEIYTAIGPILVAVNPFEPVEQCSEAHLAELTESLAAADELPPHVFRVARMAYDAMRSTRVRHNLGVDWWRDGDLKGLVERWGSGVDWWRDGDLEGLVEGWCRGGGMVPPAPAPTHDSSAV